LMTEPAQVPCEPPLAATDVDRSPPRRRQKVKELIQRNRQ
jgi:hypothetical protein